MNWTWLCVQGSSIAWHAMLNGTFVVKLCQRREPAIVHHLAWRVSGGGKIRLLCIQNIHGHCPVLF